MNGEVKRICDEIVRLCAPGLVILYGSKLDGATGDLREVSMCVVVDGDDAEGIERALYMGIDSDLSYNLILYTRQQWIDLTADEQSYACKIMRKGTVLYGQR